MSRSSGFVAAAVLLVLVGCVACGARADDSYVAALNHSKQNVMPSTKQTETRNARNDFQPSVGVYPSNNENSEALSGNYVTPDTSYGSPAHISPSYGTPAAAPLAAYGAPIGQQTTGDWVSSSTSYQHAPSGPPKPVYGAPLGPVYEQHLQHQQHAAVGVHHRPVYVPTIQQVYYGHSGPPAVGWEGPRDHDWLLNKLKFKLDFFTIGKILLKLIIFKKIVKFIALIGLLLVLPKFQSKDDDEVKDDEAMEERRQLDEKYDLSARINETTTFALTAMDAFSRKYPNECGGQLDVTCRLGKMIDAVDARYPYQKIVQLYSPKEQLETLEPADNAIAT